MTSSSFKQYGKYVLAVALIVAAFIASVNLNTYLVKVSAEESHFITACSGTTGSDARKLCGMRIRGYIEANVWQLKFAPATAIFCPPYSEPYNDITENVIKWVTANEQGTSQQDAAISIMKALASVYPCHTV